MFKGYGYQAWGSKNLSVTADKHPSPPADPFRQPTLKEILMSVAPDIFQTPTTLSTTLSSFFRLSSHLIILHNCQIRM